VNISKHGEIEANSLSFKFDASQYRENMEIKLYVHFFSSSFQVSGGWRHSMALTSNGQLFGWGWNKVGTLQFLLFS
jgi:alpha-tubulin suppressor-like RCC1 family protein